MGIAKKFSQKAFCKMLVEVLAVKLRKSLAELVHHSKHIGKGDYIREPHWGCDDVFALLCDVHQSFRSEP